MISSIWLILQENSELRKQDKNPEMGAVSNKDTPGQGGLALVKFEFSL